MLVAVLAAGAAALLSMLSPGRTRIDALVPRLTPERTVPEGAAGDAPRDPGRHWRAAPHQHWRAARGEREERRRAAEELPHLVALIAVGAEAGAPVSAAVLHACHAHGGPLVAPLLRAADSLAWGADPVQTWRAVEVDPALAPVARALGRSASSGASVVRALESVADDLAAEARAAREDAARQVGVRAAVPLGLCLLPAFLLLGIVPLVAGMASSLLP